MLPRIASKFGWFQAEYEGLLVLAHVKHIECSWCTEGSLLTLRMVPSWLVLSKVEVGCGETWGLSLSNLVILQHGEILFGDCCWGTDLLLAQIYLTCWIFLYC